MKASVKVMRSYDYCHFEVCIGWDDLKFEDTAEFTKAVDDLRKDAARLADKAVIQYKTAKKHYQEALYRGKQVKHYRKEVDEIQKIPEPEWTPRQKAQIKALADYEFMLSKLYDYQDGWEDRWDQEEYDGQEE